MTQSPIVDLSTLNPEQLKAVTFAEGPLLIIAGAGTGKTRVVTSRIIHLLDKGISHSDILALTFTEKATEEMIERIDSALPYSYDELSIHTFHGFCDRILRDYGIEIGLDSSYTLMNQLQQWVFIKKNLFNFELKYYRPLGNPSRFISALASHFSRLKDEDISPEKYLEYAGKFQANTEDEILEKERLTEIAECYKTYQDLLIKDNKLDFNDLQYYVLRLLEKRPQILKQLQNKYKYIMVDEFQDSNYAQSKLVYLLANNHKNIAVVGDDDQSIYRWRGASMANILDFENHFPGCTKIILKENYRSSQPILDTSYKLIQENNPHRLEHSHKIDKSLNSQLDLNEKIDIHHFSHYLYENKYIADGIEKYISKDSNNYSDIAVLVRSHSLAIPVIEELKARGIPFQVQNRSSLFALEEIKDLIGLLKFCGNPYDTISLYRILAMEYFNFPIESTLKLLQLANKTKDALFVICKKALDEDSGILPSTDKESLKQIFNLLNDLLFFSKEHSAAQILSEFLIKSEYLKFLQKNESLENTEKIINISEFLKMGKEFEAEQGDNRIIHFLEYLSMIENLSPTLDTNLQNFQCDAVQIMTIHAAKGLEFPVVYIPSVVQNRFPVVNRREPIEIPRELITEEIPHEDMHVQEERRLFYVACTRAKEKLHITYSDTYSGTRKWKPSRFIKDIEESEHINTIDHDDEVEINLSNEPQKEQQTNQVVSKRKESKFSYSKFDTFKMCPLKYNFRYNYSIPSPDAHAANFGSSIHNTLNDFYKLIIENKFATIEILQALYEKNWIPYGYDSKAHENTRKKRGLEILKEFYDKNSDPWIVPYALEKAFNLKVGPNSINGRIDRIDKLNDGTYEIIDYKTGKLKKGKTLDKDLQLSVYALAAKEIYKIPVSKLSLYFLEDNEKVSTSRTDEQLENAKEELIKIADDLNMSDFDPTPGFHCSFCEYRLICNKAQY